MPNLKSAKKRMKTDDKKRLHNATIKSTMRNISKKTLAAVSAKDKDLAQKTLNEAFSKIDRAAKNSLLHKKTASRQKAALATAVSKI